VPGSENAAAVNSIDETLLRLLACPYDGAGLRFENGALECPRAHIFAIEHGVPVFTEHPRREPFPLNMRALPKAGTLDRARQPESIDPFVNDWIVNTNGNLYWRARGRLVRYPIPRWAFAPGNGKTLLDIGCSWGRWSIAAAHAGFHPIGLDLHLDALAAAVRVSRQLNASCKFLCAGAENLPLASRSVDFVLSYSVLQHIDKPAVLRAFQEVARVLKPGGVCMIQLPNKAGPLSLLQQLRRGFREARTGSFEMRYWSRKEILRAFAAAGLVNVRITADGFLSQNPQLRDLDLLTAAGKLIVLASSAGHKAAGALPVLTRVADSLWIEARKPATR